MKLDRIITILTDVMIDTSSGDPLQEETRTAVRVLLTDLQTIRSLQDAQTIRRKDKKALVETLDLLQTIIQPACTAIESLVKAVERAGAQTTHGGG